MGLLSAHGLPFGAFSNRLCLRCPSTFIKPGSSRCHLIGRLVFLVAVSAITASRFVSPYLGSTWFSLNSGPDIRVHFNSQFNFYLLLVAVSALTASECIGFLGLTCLPSVVWLGYLRMFCLWLLLVVVIHNSGFAEKAFTQNTSTGSLSLVAIPTRPNLSVAATGGFTVDLQDAGIPSQQGSRTFGSDQKKFERSNDKPRQRSMALWTMPANGQIFANILSQLWQLVGGCYRQLLRPPTKRWEGAMGSKLDMECMGRICNTKTQCDEGQKFVSTQERQRPGERQGKGQRQKRRWTTSAAFSLQHLYCIIAACTADTYPLSGNAADPAHFIDTYGWTPTRFRVDSSYPESIPRCELNAPRSQGGIGQIRAGSDAAGHSRPPSCYGQSWPCTEGCARVDGIKRSSQAQVDAVPPRLPEVVERPNDSVRCSAGELRASHCQSQGGHESGASQHPSAQCSSGREASTRAVGRSEGRIGISSGHGSRRKSVKEEVARPHGTVCNQGMWEPEGGENRSRSNPGLRRRTTRNQKTSFSLASWWGIIWIRSSSSCQEYCASENLIVSFGSVSSCLRNVGRGPRNQGRVRFIGVEAYPSFYDRVGAASSEIRPYDCLFNCNQTYAVPKDWHTDEFQATIAAASLRCSVALNNSFEILSDDANWYLFDEPTGVPCRNRIPQSDLPAVEYLPQVEVGLVDNDCPKSPFWKDWCISTTSFTPLRYRLLDERTSASVSADPDAHAFIEGQERHGDPEDDQLVIIDGWQDLLEILHQHTPSPDSLIHLEMYGLHITHHSIRITDCEATIAAIREAVQESWRDAMPPRSVAYIHLVRPQEQRHARAVVLQLIVEIVPFGVDIPPNDVPILRRIKWHRDHSITLETAYMRDHQTGYELLFDAHLDEWCHPRHGVQCNLHIESRIALMADRHHLLSGSLLEIFIHDDDRPEPSASSQHADLQTGPQPSTSDTFGPLQDRLADWPSPNIFLVMYGLSGSSLGTRYSTSQVDYQQVRAAVLHTWQDHVQPDTSIVLHIVRPQDDRQPDHLHLIVELTSPSQARPAGYLPILQRISWHNIWQGDTSAAVYRVPGQNMREMLAACSLAEWCGPSTRAICRMQVERRPIPITELIEFQAGSLLEVLVSLQHVEEDGASLLQSGAPVSVIRHAEPSNVPLGSLSTHVNDRWCDSSSSCDVQESVLKARLIQARPNNDIVPDQDSQVPYQYRLHNGARIPGTIIPPPNWNRLPGLRYASDRGAVVRDADHQLRVRIRSWLVPHDRFGPMYWKDCTIPAQLFLRLLDRLKSVWRPELFEGDRLRMRIVQPTPAPPVGDQARLYILLECNRPHVSTRKAILLSFQELNADGPSPDLTWIPYLAPEVITPQIIAGVLPMHCDPRHLIVPAGTPDRRWLAEHEERAVDDGLYLPTLRDIRRVVPTQRIEIDEATLIQTGLREEEGDDLLLMQRDEDGSADALQLMQRSSSRSPRRGLPPSTSTDGSGPDLLLVHTYHMSASHKLVHLDKSRPLSYSAQLEEIWRFPPHTSILGLHEVRHPPQDLESTSQATLLIERTVDLHRQAIADDQPVLADLVLSGAGTVDPIQIRRVVWTRRFMTRPAVLHLFAAQEFCSSPEVTCHLSVNRAVWSQHDTASRELRHGDFFCLRIAGPLTMTNEEIRTVLIDQEHADASRYLYCSSPARSSPPPTTPDEGGESEPETLQDPPADAIDAADSQLDAYAESHRTSTTMIRKPAQRRSPLADVTNLTRFDAYHNARPASQPDTMNSSGLPHVTDRWCARPVDFRVPDCLAEPRLISLSDSIPSPPEIVVPCQHLQFVRNQLLQCSLGTPGSISQLVKWHSTTQIAFDETPPWTDELPISYELFTDGSSVFLESSRNGAAAVVLIVNTISGPRFGGTHCFHVDAPATAPRAEVVAMLGAVLWAVELAGRHPSATPHFRFGFDNTLAGNAAAGYWSPSCHLDVQTCIRSLCHWMQARFGDDVFEWAHVKAHSGHPWNEAADALSWAAVAQWIPVQPLLELLPDLLLVDQHPGTHEWLWLLEYALQHRPGAPRVDLLGFHFRLDHPFEQQPHARAHPLLQRQRDAVAGPRTASTFTLRCSTANVLTLQSGGLGARAEHLASQFLQAGVHCIGLQETRSRLSGHHFFDEFHVLSAPSARGVGGVQFWIRRTWY